MKNIGTIYLFEMKKILKNRLTVAMLIVTVIIIVMQALAPGMAGVTKEVREAQKTLDGTPVDDALLQKMYPLLQDNGKTWTEDNQKYAGIARMAMMILPNDAVLSDYSADDLYRIRKEENHRMMQEDLLSAEEIAWWEQQEAKTPEPFRYYYYEGTLSLAQGVSGILLCILLITTLCLSSVFTVEHRQRTDQLVLSCRNGRKETYLVKIAAGLSVVMGCAILGSALLALLDLLLYGLDGLNAPVQLEIPMSEYPFTMGQFILVQLGVMLAAAVLFAVFAMTVAEIFKNNLVPIGIMIGLFVFGQLEIIPPRFRLLAQLNEMLPSNQISLWSLMEYRLVGFGGHYLSDYAASPLAYLLLSVILILVTRVVYDRFQVTGR